MRTESGRNVCLGVPQLTWLADTNVAFDDNPPSWHHTKRDVLNCDVNMMICVPPPTGPWVGTMRDTHNRRTYLNKTPSVVKSTRLLVTSRGTLPASACVI